MTKTRALFGAGWFFLLAGCANFSITSVPDTSFAPGRAVEATMAAYYEDHAVEFNTGACNRPYFDAITRVDVLEESAQQLVLDIRYAYRDRLRDDENTRSRKPRSSRKLCRGFESRQFTFTKDDDDHVDVIEMTGPSRGASADQSKVTLGGNVGVSIGSGATVGN